nr:uncharacterized protein LOC109242719 [Ipomoea batatas]
MEGRSPQLIFACTLILLMLWEMPSLSSACDTYSGGCRDCIVKHTMKDCPKCSTIMCCMAQCLWGGSSRSKCTKKCDCNGGYPRLSDCKNCLSPCKCSCSA